MAGPVNHQRGPRPPRDIEWGWIVFLIVSLAAGLALLWGVLYVVEGR